MQIFIVEGAKLISGLILFASAWGHLVGFGFAA